MQMTNKAVEAIWERYRHVMPGWTGPVLDPRLDHGKFELRISDLVKTR